MESEYEGKITLISSDSQKFEISQKAARRSEVIKDSIESSKNDHIEFNVNNVKGDVLKKVVEYLEHYENEEPKIIERPLPSANLKDIFDEWDYNFINVRLDNIFSIILASNYLNIKPLLELASAAIAGYIKGKPADELRNEFNITNDFTPEEEQQIIEENKWCMENL